MKPKMHSTLQRIVITGANGAGKTHLANQLHATAPKVPLFSFDAVKLTTDWQQKPRSEIALKLDQILAQPAWILEGGPSMLEKAIPHAQALIIMEPPEWQRALRLAIRPWKNVGRTRPELPAGNRDWPWQQYRFARRSLKNRAWFKAHIAHCLKQGTPPKVWRLSTASQIEAFLKKWRAAHRQQ